MKFGALAVFAFALRFICLLFTKQTVNYWLTYSDIPLGVFDRSREYLLDLGKMLKPLTRHQLISMSSERKAFFYSVD